MHRFLTLALLPTLLLCACEEPDTPEAAGVRAAYQGLEYAAETFDGEEAVSYVAQRSIDYYTGIVRLAIDGSKEQVLALPHIDVYEVIAMRNRVDLKELEKMDGRAWLVYSLSQDWSLDDEEEMEPIELGRISVSGDYASAALIDQGTRTGRFVDFYLEDGRWKIDLQSWDNLWNEQIEDAAAESEMEVVEFLLALEDYDYGLRPEVATWTPMRSWRR